MQTTGVPLGGNLWEWVDTDYAPITEYWQVGYKVIKGGAFNTANTVDRNGKSYLSILGSTSLEHPSEPHNPNRIGFGCIRHPTSQ